MLVWLLVEAVADMADPANSYAGTAWFGLGPPLVIALGLSLAGLLLMLARRAVSGTFWTERPTAWPAPSAARAQDVPEAAPREPAGSAARD
ncbi:hypothetical protein [Streptomyces sp. NPDC090021]|uniref:hypothetical protein n=1 Tax=Streptomyces sp. NPDC090021 TaxID=3365919 RepID=UPI00381C2A9A